MAGRQLRVDFSELPPGLYSTDLELVVGDANVIAANRPFEIVPEVMRDVESRIRDR